MPQQSAVGPAGKAIGERAADVDPEFPRLGGHAVRTVRGRWAGAGTAERQAAKIARLRSSIGEAIVAAGV